MIARQVSPGRARQHRARWALSFADLCLLLLAFFALLQANQSTRNQTLAGIGNYFGAIQSNHQADLAALDLFEPGEALLSPSGRAQLLKAAQPFAQSKLTIHIQSIGIDAQLSAVCAGRSGLRRWTRERLGVRRWIGGGRTRTHVG